MSWGTSLAVGFLSAIIAAVAAGLVTYGCTVWYRVESMEAGFTTIIIGLLGLIAGFIMGVVSARVSGNFWQGLGCSAAIILVLAGVAALFGRIGGEVAPTIGGEQLMLEVELKCPRGWTPGNREAEWNPLSIDHTSGKGVYGCLAWDRARQDEQGRWIVPGGIWLFSSRQNRRVQITVCRKAEVAFRLPLPARPGTKDEDWTPWTSEGIDVRRYVSPQRGNVANGQPPAADYEFRVRVQRQSVVRQRDLDRAAGKAERLKELAGSLRPSDPLERWLGLFEPGNIVGGMIIERPDDPLGQGMLVVRTKMAEFPRVLGSSDLRLVKRAMDVLSMVRHDIPPELFPAIGESGRQVLTLVHAARAAGQAGEPDLAAEHEAYNFFLCWDNLMQLDPAAAAVRLSTLEEIVADVKDQDGDLGEIARYARQDVESLRASGTGAGRP